MYKSGSTKTTQIDYVNSNNQINCGTRGKKGNDNNQVSYKLECQECKYTYGANGSDIFQRKCPHCQNGNDGIPY